MSLLTLIRRMISSLFFLNIVKRYKGRASLMKIKAAQFYVKGVHKARFLILGFVLALISMIFLAFGLSLIHTALFTYSTWSIKTKFILALLLGGAEFIGAIGVLSYLFKEEIWGKFFGVHHVVNSVVKDRKQRDSNEGNDGAEVT